MKRYRYALVALVGASLAMPTLALADVVHTCVKGNGQIRVVSNPASCLPQETPLALSSAGPPQVITVWQSTQVEAPPGVKVQVTATCPEGMVVLGGGGQANDPTVVQPGQAELDTSRPDPFLSDNPTGWFVSAKRSAGAGFGQIFVVASAICGG
jgi:hypothetical protein